MKKAAIFDIDNTLIKGSAATYFGKSLFFKGKAGPIMLIRLLYYTFLFVIGKLNVREVMEKNTFFTGGHSVEEYEMESNEAFTKYIHKVIYKEMKDIIEKHRSDGYMIIFASSGLKFTAVPIANFLDANSGENFLTSSFKTLYCSSVSL